MRMRVQNITVKYYCEKGHYPKPSGISEDAEDEPVIQGINFAAINIDSLGVMTLDLHFASDKDFLLSAYCPGFHDKGEVFSYSAP